jgi:porin
VQAAVYDGLPDTSSSGTRINLNEDEGALAYFELGFRLNPGPDDPGLPGNYKVGAYYHTDDFAYNDSVVLGEPVTRYHSGNYGFYALADQFLYRENMEPPPARQGLAAFVRVTAAPPEYNLTQFGLDGGLVYQGLIPGRDYDTLALAGSYLEISDDLSDSQELVNSFFPGFFPYIADYEAVVELNYKAQMSAWWSLHTSLQRVLHPGGSSEIPDAWVVILGSLFRF